MHFNGLFSSSYIITESSAQLPSIANRGLSLIPIILGIKAQPFRWQSSNSPDLSGRCTENSIWYIWGFEAWVCPLKGLIMWLDVQNECSMGYSYLILTWKLVNLTIHGWAYLCFQNHFEPSFPWLWPSNFSPWKNQIYTGAKFMSDMLIFGTDTWSNIGY